MVAAAGAPKVEAVGAVGAEGDAVDCKKLPFCATKRGLAGEANTLVAGVAAAGEPKPLPNDVDDALPPKSEDDGAVVVGGTLGDAGSDAFLANKEPPAANGDD